VNFTCGLGALRQPGSSMRALLSRPQ
jgi:hypothetical protein